LNPVGSKPNTGTKKTASPTFEWKGCLHSKNLCLIHPFEAKVSPAAELLQKAPGIIP
jgi:hypothetical protein